MNCYKLRLNRCPIPGGGKDHMGGAKDHMGGYSDLRGLLSVSFYSGSDDFGSILGSLNSESLHEKES